MPIRLIITDTQLNEIKSARKRNMNKNIDKQLRVLVLHAEGESRASISLKTEYNITCVSRIVSLYSKKGLIAIVGNNYKGNHRNLSFEEEAKVLTPFIEVAKKGQLIDISQIKQAYEKELGRVINSKGHIYRVLARHGWRKIMPRTVHPNKASEEVIASSKKNSKIWSVKS